MKTVALKIREQHWSGRARIPIPSTERDLYLAEGATFDLSYYGDRHICAVTHIAADAIEVAAVGRAPALVADDGSFGSPGLTSPTRLGLGQSVKVGTWTLDQGASWDIRVERILD